MVVVQLGNSKVAASWTRIFFLDEHVVWICGFRISALSIFCTVFFLIGSWHVGSSGGHRRAVTAGHRKGPGGD